ncbi:esterase [Aggregatimonas sangjinii]|uniref:Esterase n=1 Tax=Aggregatimonas sangjinii TaxID=2583587 RepID=A0A5B7SPA8_9FLAO|nr:alpha/beta hydrolase-fold protein [Aggregatimonas sangjinii]QCW98857.1 esterase [Aggregatimonas sangjinii]
MVSQNTKDENGYGKSSVLQSDILGEERDIQIYLPPSYGTLSKKYPVLYVIDAQRYFLNGIAFQQNLAWQEIVPEFIVVGIQTDAVRRRELFDSEASKFIRFLEDELIPEINASYVTLDERMYFGWEMAAGLGVQLLATKPHLFTGLLLASPTHISADRLNKVDSLLKNGLNHDVSIYAALGTVENWATASLFSLDSLFQKHPTKKIQWTYHLSNKENHYTTPLITMNEGLKLFFKDYGPIRFHSMQEFSDFGGIESLKKHYQNRGKRYQISEAIHLDTKHYLLVQAHQENDFETFEALVREADGKMFIKDYYRQARWFGRYASFYLDNDRPEDALDILALGFEKFPEASILHYAKGNYYKKIGKINEARQWYEKAIHIAKTNQEPELQRYKTELRKL